MARAQSFHKNTICASTTMSRNVPFQREPGLLGLHPRIV
jgi:hypothetical protein